ncbi:hypothetical protein, partial [Salmonella enterica]|uniref:hypothetical protein n=1 Tax=Salmonella enterica TaxID=28901 RepID=UPI0020C44C36
YKQSFANGRWPYLSIFCRMAMLMSRLIRPGRRDFSGPVSAPHPAKNHYIARPASMASINKPVIENGDSASN